MVEDVADVDADVLGQECFGVACEVCEDVLEGATIRRILLSSRLSS